VDVLRVRHVSGKAEQGPGFDMSETPKIKRENKAVYQPPQVVRVSLRPEEAVLGHCKVSGSAGPASASCRTLGPCRSHGS
jgi:hypothetical protein